MCTVFFTALRIDEEIKDVLEEFSRDKLMKEKLLTGRRVTLAEELSRFFLLIKTEMFDENISRKLFSLLFFVERVKHIHEKLEEFIKALNKEKRENHRLQ